MNNSIKERCELFIENVNILKECFKWDHTVANLSAAAFFVNSGIKVNAERLKECEAILKKEEGVFSGMRGALKLPVICKMYSKEDPIAYIKKVREMKDLTAGLKIFDDNYKLSAALVICDRAEEGKEKELAEKTKEIFKRMKEEHSWLTSGEDLPFAALLAATGRPVDELVAEMEESYRLCKGTFKDSNARQTLSHVITLCEGSVEEKSEKVCSIFKKLKEQKHKYGSGYEVALIGALSSSKKFVDEIVNDIIEIDDYLKEIKGFGSISLGADLRRAFAAMMVVEDDADAAYNSEVAMTASVAMMVILEICEVAMIAAMTTTVVMMD